MRTLLVALGLSLAGPALAQQPPPPPPEEHDPFMQRLWEREADLLERVRAFDEERYRQLVALKARDRRAYAAALLRVARLSDGAGPRPNPELRAQMARIEALKARHPDGFGDLDRKALQEVRKELTDIANAIFDARQEERRRRIEELRSALSDLEEDVARRDRERGDLIDDFVEQVLRGPVDL